VDGIDATHLLLNETPLLSWLDSRHVRRHERHFMMNSGHVHEIPRLPYPVIVE
jgi:hypothetical protein